ncbi:hypothetical protein B0H14DRAFT_2728457 [Mycena olivaceomarginata]|nr:hypothetical protein B0H14DRAFT_2728457 [Mycena olivaceomarginata]
MDSSTHLADHSVLAADDLRPDQLIRLYGTPDAVVIHPPFDNLPEADDLSGGMTYLIMQKHSNWFLDATEYTSIPYPDTLKPPRVRRTANLSLRCTFCPTALEGINAKGSWMRHVKNRHKAVLITPRVGRQPHDVPPLFIQPRMSSENGILNTSPLAKLDEEIDADAEGETDDES